MPLIYRATVYVLTKIQQLKRNFFDPFKQLYNKNRDKRKLKWNNKSNFTSKRLEKRGNHKMWELLKEYCFDLSVVIQDWIPKHPYLFKSRLSRKIPQFLSRNRGHNCKQSSAVMQTSSFCSEFALFAQERGAWFWPFPPITFMYTNFRLARTHDFRSTIPRDYRYSVGSGNLMIESREVSSENWLRNPTQWEVCFCSQCQKFGFVMLLILI